MKLSDIRQHIQSLASEEGTYYLVCSKTGDRPVPTAGLYFRSRITAQAAARATEQYRAVLRQYDPQYPVYNIVVCQSHRFEPTATGGASVSDHCCDEREKTWRLSPPVITRPETTAGDRIEFCHAVATAVFEALSDHEYPSVQAAIMDSYCELADRISGPDELCVCLLERMAIELAEQLSQREQLTVLATAATKLDTVVSTETGLGTAAGTALDDVFSQLQTIGLFETYEHRAGPRDGETVAVTEYALSEYAGRLPLLPILVELYRCEQHRKPVSVAPTDTGWRLEFIEAERPLSPTECSIAPKVM